MKPGYQTTEFWLTLASNLIGGAISVGLVPSEGTSAKVIALMSLTLATYGYTYSRGMVKSANNNQE